MRVSMLVVPSWFPSSEEGEVSRVLVESWEPVEAVRAWLVSIVTLDSAPDVRKVLALSATDVAVEGRDVGMPRLAALAIRASRTDSILPVGTNKTWFRKLTSASSGRVVVLPSMAMAFP